VKFAHCLDVIPASGRMMTKNVSKPEQKKVIDTAFALPWSQERQRYILILICGDASLSHKEIYCCCIRLVGGQG
jgi:hypothetical protein